MTGYKIFSGAATSGDLIALETAVNAWLESERPRVTHFAQAVLGTDLILSFVYEDASEEAHDMRAEEAAEVPDVFERNLEDAELDPTNDTPLLPEAELPY